MSAENLAKFLTDLANDQDMKDRFNNDPDGTMDAAGLTGEEKAAVRTGDAEQIRPHLGDNYAGLCPVVDNGKFKP